MTAYGTAVREGTPRAFRVEGDRVAFLPAADVGELLRSPELLVASGEAADAPARIDLLPPMLDPQKFVCAGLNYFEHAREVGKTAPHYPTLFAKYASALVGPYAPLLMPAPEVSARVDWEAELVIVIGARVYQADEATAASAIFGYTATNDVSMRDWQKRTDEWLQGKNFDSSTPLGPVVVTADELDVAGGLAITTHVNGRQVQAGTTSDLIFSPVQLVRYISSFMTLNPGDLIATGTPAGVGNARKPPLFLANGDELVTAIEGIGEMRNRCTSAREGGRKSVA